MRLQNLRAAPAALVAIVAFVVTTTPLDAAPFTNLDFERASVVNPIPMFGFLDWNLAVPGWQHSTGSDLGIVYYGQQHLGISGYYMLYDAVSPFYAPNTQLAGNFSVGIANGAVSSSGVSPFQYSFLSQIGDIPADARSIRLLAVGNLRLSVAANDIPMVSLGGNLWAGDVSMFAGTTAELKITNGIYAIHNPLLIDNIAFSPVPVPEPTAVVLLAAVASLAGTGRRR